MELSNAIRLLDKNTRVSEVSKYVESGNVSEAYDTAIEVIIDAINEEKSMLNDIFKSILEDNIEEDDGVIVITTARIKKIFYEKSGINVQ